MTDPPVLLQNARIIDPSTDRDTIGSIAMADGRIVDPTELADHDQVQTIDATDSIAMAGGIDLHTHIGGGKLTIARMLLGDQPDVDNVDRFLPTASQVADRYLDMGYTTCFEPAVLPGNARAAHAEMMDVRGIDTGGYCLLGNDQTLLAMIADDVGQPMINDYVAYMVRATRSVAVKVVNAGGIDAFKYNVRQLDVDHRHPRYEITPGQIIRTLCRAVHEIGLVHPLHVHCSNLGRPGNIQSTLATIAAADGLPIHLTHAQFHSYAETQPDDNSAIASAADQLIDAMNKHPNVTMDVGQIMFGQTVTISADAMHQTANMKFASPKRSMILAIECESGCGVVPFRYRRKNFVNAMQWAIGLELFLMMDDPSRVFLTTDHPNGGPFTTYPHLLRLLSDKTFRETALSEIHPDVAAASHLAGMDREYSLTEIATMTRSGPAGILGLDDRGTLRPGSIADVVLYKADDNREQMFANPAFVFRKGRMVRRGGQRIVPSDQYDETLVASVEVDDHSIGTLRKRFAKDSTYALDRLWIDDRDLGDEFNCRSVRVEKRH